MPQISVKIPDHLSQELELKSQELGMNKSVLIKDLLRLGLANLRSQETSNLDLAHLLKQNISYTLMSYCLIEKTILDYVEGGSVLCDKAFSKAETLINSILQKGAINHSETPDLSELNSDPITESRDR